MNNDLTPKQQASEALRQAETILIATGQNPSVDQISSVIALTLILRKLGKKVSAVISDNLPNQVGHLPTDNIDTTLSGLRDFIIRLDLSKSEVDRLKYTIDDGKLNIYITPFKGGFSPDRVSHDYGDYYFDLAVVLGVASRNKIDRVIQQNPKLFDSVPILNIDFHRSNENYAAINLVDPNAASLAEILIALAESLQNGLIDEQIATALLTGIVASTDRFSANHTTPKSLTVAAQMMAAGAKQQQVIKNLYKNDKNEQRQPKQQQQQQQQPAKNKPQPVEMQAERKPEPEKAASPQDQPKDEQSPDPENQPAAKVIELAPNRGMEPMPEELDEDYRGPNFGFAEPEEHLVIESKPAEVPEPKSD